MCNLRAGVSIVFVIAALVRALVETAIRKGRDEPLNVPATLLRTWTWQTSRHGVDAELINPLTGMLAPTSEALAQLLNEVGPVLSEYNGSIPVTSELVSISRQASLGCSGRRQVRSSE